MNVFSGYKFQGSVEELPVVTKYKAFLWLAASFQSSVSIYSFIANCSESEYISDLVSIRLI